MAEKKVALVTGVSSGIGLATAKTLLNAGFRTFGTVRDPSKAGQLATGLELIRLDVREEGSVRSCVKTIFDQAGRIDALVNSAGFNLIGALEETSLEEAKGMFETNFFGVLRLSQEVLPIMRKQGYGRIVNISSVLGFAPAPYMGVYSASKYAVEGYSETLDHEVRQFGIHVSLVEPSFTRTNFGHNGQVVSQTLNAYSPERTKVLDAVQEGVAKGDDPVTVAAAVLQALTDRVPRLRYPAGREAKLLTQAKRWAPAKIFDGGVRKKFGLAK
jgi:short-subunit dehydrogenase